MINKLLVTAAALALTAMSASAETIRWARAGDSITLDPHSQNEGPTHALAHQMYDPLLQRDMSGAIIPVWPPNGRLCRIIPIFGVSNCARASPIMTARPLILKMWCFP